MDNKLHQDYACESFEIRYSCVKKEKNIPLIVLAFIAFISLGLPDGLLGVSWPSMRKDFSLPLDALGWLLFASVSGYITSSFFNGVAIRKLGIGKLLSLSCGATGMALIAYTLVPEWYMDCLCGIIAGLGAGAIDAGLNVFDTWRVGYTVGGGPSYFYLWHWNR